jgi:ATP-dependent helicase Lhr and Lhr-like helicase
MLAIYRGADIPHYLDVNAVRLLNEGRTNFTRFGLQDNPILARGADTLVFPWRGDRVMSTLALALTGNHVDAAQDGVCLTIIGTDRAGVLALLRQLHDDGPPDPLTLASRVSTKAVEKYDDYLTDELLDEVFAARSLDIDGARIALAALLSSATRDVGQGRSSGEAG